MSEYSAVIVRLPELTPLAGCDNVAGARIFGLQAIVSKDSVPGTLGVWFPAETKLSDEFLRENNLYRHSDRNKDENLKGYFEDNGRVKAVKFRGHRSDSFWMPLTALSYIPGEHVFTEGFAFQELLGHKICEKYVLKHLAGKNNAGNKVLHRTSEAQFPKHFDTPNFFRNGGSIDSFEYVTVTQKLHGTSVRIGNVLVDQPRTWKHKVLRFFGIELPSKAYEIVAGSRNVIKDAKNPDGGFYSQDIYTLTADKIKHLIPEGYVIYGELIGWTPDGQPIQKEYTYCLPRGQMELYVYRVVTVNPQGVQADLSWPALVEFCRERGLKWTPKLDDGILIDTDVIVYTDLRFCDGIYDEPVVRLEDNNPSDEGVCIRIEGMTPRVFKAKSPLFLQHETKLLDKDEVDMETVG